jgi:ubiquinone/menaquinone biosynthesis C-methylase UbiE
VSAVTDIWLAEARGWAAWAHQGDDGFSEFRTLLPAPGHATLDLGCGEGRFARALTAEGHAVTGADLSIELVELAAAADPGGEYVVADAEELPFGSATFDLVVAFNVLSCVAELGRALGEVARVLSRGGRLCMSIVHPMYTGGRRVDGAWSIGGEYMEERLHTERVRRGEAELTFANIHRPLGAYTEALEHAGLHLEALREPEWELVPMFLHMRAVKP